MIGTLNANFNTIYGAINVRKGTMNDNPGSKYTLQNAQIERRYGMKFRGFKIGLKNRISLYDSFSNLESFDKRLLSSFSHFAISPKIVLHFG